MKKIFLKMLSLALIIFGITILSIYFTKNKVSDIIYEGKINEKIVANNDYYAILEIPKINLKRELYPKNNENNNVDKNLFLHDSSTFPEEKTSNLIILGHSGTGAHAYFKNLYQLEINDLINLYYNNNLYTYELKEYEHQKKTGVLYLKHNYNHELVLITCTKNNSKTQTIYYAELKNIQKSVKN